MAFDDDDERYQRVLRRMHIATERNQPGWELCPYPTKPRWRFGETLVEDYEKEREELRELRRHWYLMYSFSRPLTEDTRKIWE